MRTWIYLQNPFLTLGLKSYKKALKLAQYTDAQLEARKTDAFYGPLYTYFNPLNSALNNEYTTWKNQGGIQKGSTLTLDQLLLVMTDKINDYDLAVQNVFRKGTPEYVTIFPQGHKPFQRGEKDMRIKAVETLVQALAAYPALPATQTLDGAYYTQLNNASTTQEGQKGNTGTDSDDVLHAVEAAMTGLYKVLGTCMAQFADDTHVIEPLFDLQTLRDHAQSIFTGTLHGGEDESVFQHTMAADDELKLQSTTAQPVHFYFSHTGVPGVNGSTIIIVDGNSEKVVKRSEFGSEDHHYLHALNPNTVEGHYRVTIL